MIKVTLELDYPTFDEAINTNLNLSTLIESNKCISFSRMEELPSINEFMAKKNEKIQELYNSMNINPDNTSENMKKAIIRIASEWMYENYYYVSSIKGKS